MPKSAKSDELIVEEITELRNTLASLDATGRIDLLKARGHLNNIQEYYQEALAELQAKAAGISTIEERLKKLTQPPLLHAILVGPNPKQPGTFVVSVGGQRLDVSVAPPEEVPIDPEQLVDGQEVLVTRESHVIVGLVGPARRGESADVLDVLQNPETGFVDRLLVRSGGNEGIVVEMAKHLHSLPEESEVAQDRGLKVGDAVLIDTASKIAFEKLPTSETSELELEVDPRDRYEDIAGLADTIEQIRDAIELPYLYRNRFAAYNLERPRGILLFGPPGCGKTMIGRAVANSLKTGITLQFDQLIQKIHLLKRLMDENVDDATLADLGKLCPAASDIDLSLEQRRELLRQSIQEDIPQGILFDQSRPDKTIKRLEMARRNIRSYFLNIKGPELLSKWVGEAEHKIRQLFAVAKRRASYTTPVVIFFDEIESMFQKRGTGISADMEKTMVPQLLTELDGVEVLENVIVIGASNRHELLDPALIRPGRLDIKMHIGRPDRNAATAIFQKYLHAGLPLSPAGLVETSPVDFDNNVAQMVDNLCDSYICVQTNRDITALLPLQLIVSGDLLSEVIRHIRENGPKRFNQHLDDRRVTYSDLAQAIRQACYKCHVQLASQQGLSGEITKVEVVLRLESAATILNEAHLPNLPLTPADTTIDLDGDPNLLSQLIIDLAVDTLFSSHSYLRARILSQCGSEYSLLLHEFISGALISNVVTRAKRLALKREVQEGSDGAAGISIQDVLAAIRAEFEENKDRFTISRPEIGEVVCEKCKRKHNAVEEFDIEVVLGRNVHDRWYLPRRRPYERSQDRRAAQYAYGGQQ